MKQALREYFKYNLLTFPIIASVYIPYQILWIQLTGFQLIKWFLTSGLYSAIANLILQPWIRFCYRRGWLKP